MLNENIKLLRNAKGYSQEELAEKLDVVRQTVSKWEKGLSVPDAGMLLKIAEALDTEVNVLLSADSVEAKSEDAIDTIAKKLELLNEQFEKQQENRRKNRRIIFGVIALVALLDIVCKLIGLINRCTLNASTDASQSIIGGADGPTTILVSKINVNGWSIVFPVLILAAAVIGISRTGRKR